MTDTLVFTDQPRRAFSPVQVFFALLRRDIYVTGKDFPIFIAQVVLQPLLLLFVFGKIITDIGYARPGYAQLLFPGIVALTATLTSIQGTALPLVIEFSGTKEIEDRLLAPLPTQWVAIEKIIFASMRALVASAVMFPVGILILGSVPFRLANLPLLILIMVLGALVGSSIGLTLGTVVAPHRVNLMFALILLPITFTGCCQYPWPSLHRLEWFQWLTTLNPLTYASEGMRGSLVPGMPHMRIWVCILMLLVSLALFVALGIRGFMRRAID